MKGIMEFNLIKTAAFYFREIDHKMEIKVMNPCTEYKLIYGMKLQIKFLWIGIWEKKNWIQLRWMYTHFMEFDATEMMDFFL